MLQAAAFVLLVAASVVALWPVQHDIGKRLDQLKAQVVLKLEKATGRRITYQSMSPSIFRFLEIRGLKVYDPGSSTPLLQIRRIEVSYSIWRLLTGQPAEALNTISIENSTLHIDTTNDSDLIRFFDDLMKGGGKATGLPSFGAITLAGKNLTLSVTSPTGTYSIDRLFFQVQNSGEAIHVQVRGGLAAVLKQGPLGLEQVNTSVRVTGSVGSRLAWSDLRVRFDNLTSNLLNLSRPTFHVTLRDNVWELRKIQDNAPIDIQASYDQTSRLLKMSFVSDGFRPEDYFTFGKRLEAYTPWLNSVITGNGTVSYSLQSHALSYSSKMSVGLNNRLIPFPLDASMEVTGNERSADFQKLNLSSRYGRIHFAGNLDLKNLLPTGTLTASNIYTPLGARLSADFNLVRRGSTVEAKSPVVLVGESILHRVSLSVSPESNTVNFALGASFDEHEGEFSGSGTVFLSQTPYILLNASTSGLPLDQLYSLIDQHPLPSVMDTLKGLKMTSHVLITTDLKRFSFASPHVTISDGGKNPERQMSLRISGNNRSLNLQDLNVDWRQYHVEGSISADYVQSDRIALASTVKLENTSYSVHGFYQVGDSLILSGNYGIDLAAVRQGDRYVFSLKTNSLPIPFSGVTTKASLDIEGIFANLSKWEAVSRNTTITDLPGLATQPNSLTLSARVSSTGGDIYSLTYTDPISTLTGNGKLSLEPGLRGFSGSGWLQLVGNASSDNESYAANFSFAPGKINASVDFANSPLVRLGKLPVSGLASGQIAVSGRPTSPDLAVRLSLPAGQFYSDPITASVDFTVSNKTVDLKNLNARYLASSLNGLTGKLDFESGKVDLAGNYRGDVNGDLLSAHIALNGSATPIRQRKELSKMLNGDFKANAQVTAITVENVPVNSWDVSIDKRGNRTIFSGGPGAGVSGYILSSGKFLLNLSDPLPITLQAEGQLAGSKINASLQNVALDLHAFDTVAKIPYFDISKGKARGNLEISGSVNDPDIQGDLAASDVYGKTPVIPNEIGPFNTNLVFQGKTLSMSDVAIRSGNAQVLGNMSFTLDHWIPDSYDLSFTTQSTQGVHVKYSISGIDFDGYANGTTTIKGGPQGVQIDGTLDINSCLITLNNADQSSTPVRRGPRPGTEANYNFTFTTGKQVQFVWPNNTVPILRAFADTGQKLKVTSQGSTGDYSIVGNINVKGGEVFYLRQNFYLRQGSIDFNEDQNKFDPIVNVRAELREVDSAGKPVSIFLVVNNKPLSQFAPSFESQPAMPNSEILTLLGQDIYSQLGGQQLDLTSAMLFTGDLLSQFSVLRTFEDKVKQAFNLDLFSVRTDLLQNIFREKVLGQTPTTATTPSSSIGRYLDNTTFFLGKYFGNDLFLEAMINLRSNNAFLSEFGNTGNLQVDSQILFEWKTPLFLLQLSFLPDPTNFLSSLTNTTLSLSWGFSF